jgi:hypothetical protein
VLKITRDVLAAPCLRPVAHGRQHGIAFR